MILISRSKKIIGLEGFVLKSKNKQLLMKILLKLKLL